MSHRIRKVVGGPGVKPGFAASDAAVLFGYTTHPSGTRAGNPTRISSLGPKRHHALDHASKKLGEPMRAPNQRKQLARAQRRSVAEPSYKWKGCRELNSDLKVRSLAPSIHWT